MRSQTFSVCLSSFVVFAVVDFFCFFQNLPFDTILAGVFAACVLHETLRFLEVPLSGDFSVQNVILAFFVCGRTT